MVVDLLPRPMVIASNVNFNVFTQKLFLKFCAPTFGIFLPLFFNFAPNTIEKKLLNPSLYVMRF